MKYLFVVQGEGRGHLTQAMTLERLLLERGHEVVGMLVGKSPQRQLPKFFTDSVKAPLSYFESMNFLPSADNRKPSMVKTVLFNTFGFHKYFPSIQLVCDAIRSSDADVVVNFYELMAGLAYFFHDIKVPMVCIGHQYLFLHKDFGLPRDQYPDSIALDFFTRLTSVNAVKLLALSFCPLDVDKKHNIVVVPPLLRDEVLEMEPTRGDYLHGYMLNSGYSDDVLQWHEAHPETELRFFWDNWDAGPVHKVDDTLTFYLINDKEFLLQMRGCRAYASTAGFESVCEAMYMGKPVLMVPSHIEQEINAYDAVRIGAGIACDHFDLSRLVEFSESFEADPAFRDWAGSAAEIIVKELENVGLD